jgi:hypothetical protein
LFYKLSLSLLVLMEMLLLIGAIYLYLAKKNYSLSEALCYSITLSFALYSSSIQIFFLIGIIDYYFLIDTIVLISSVYIIFRHKELIGPTVQKIKRFYLDYRYILFFFLIGFAYLFFQAFLLPPDSVDCMTYNLARVLLMDNENSLFLNNYTTMRQILSPVGYDILHYMFLRFRSDFSLGFFSFLSYVIIILGNYALIIKKYNRETSLTVSLIISSLTELVLQSTSTKNDIPCGAAGIICLLAGYNVFHRKDGLSCLVLLIACLLGSSFKIYFPGFCLPFVFFFFIFFYKRERFKGIVEIVKNTFRAPFILHILLVSIMICTGYFFIYNYFTYKDSPDYAEQMSFTNQDGIAGCVVNIIRYSIQSLEIPEMFGGKYIDTWHNLLLGKWKNIGSIDLLHYSLFWIHKDISSEGNVKLSSSPLISEYQKWFGLFGWTLVIPSVIYSLFNYRDDYMRITSLSLIGFFIALSYKVPWMLWNSRFFPLFFCPSGLCIAHFLSTVELKDFRLDFLRWKFIQVILFILMIMSFLIGVMIKYNSQFVDKLLAMAMNLTGRTVRLTLINRLGPICVTFFISIGIIILLLFYAGKYYRKFCDELNHKYNYVLLVSLALLFLYYVLLNNMYKPFTGWYRYVWDRKAYYREELGNIIDEYDKSIKPGSRVLISGGTESWVYPFMFYRNDLRRTIASPLRLYSDGQIFNPSNPGDFDKFKSRFDYLLLVQLEPEFLDLSKEKLLYNNKGSYLYKLLKED